MYAVERRKAYHLSCTINRKPKLYYTQYLNFRCRPRTLPDGHLSCHCQTPHSLSTGRNTRTQTPCPS